MLLVETGGETEVGELDMPAAIKEDIVRFDVTEVVSIGWESSASFMHLPMDETKLMHSFYGQD